MGGNMGDLGKTPVLHGKIRPGMIPMADRPGTIFQKLCSESFWFPFLKLEKLEIVGFVGATIDFSVYGNLEPLNEPTRLFVFKNLTVPIDDCL